MRAQHGRSGAAICQLCSHREAASSEQAVAQSAQTQSRSATHPHVPHAILSPGWSGSPVGLAWYSMLGSYRLLRQICSGELSAA